MSAGLRSPALMALLGVAVGLGVALLLTPLMDERLDPHEWIVEDADRIYVSEACSFSEDLAAAVATTGLSAQLLLVPVDLRSTSRRSELCERIFSRHKEAGMMWPDLLPADYLCDKLAVRANAFVVKEFDSRVPAAVVGNQKIFPIESVADLEGALVNLRDAR